MPPGGQKRTGKANAAADEMDQGRMLRCSGGRTVVLIATPRRAGERARGRSGGRYLNYRPARTVFHLPSLPGLCGSLDLEAAATIGSDGLMTSFAWAMRRPS